MKKTFYIILIFCISVIHTVVLDTWLTDKEFVHKTSELSIERNEAIIIADSLSLSPKKNLIKTSVDTRSGSSASGQSN